MLRDFEKGDMVQYFDLAHGGIPFRKDNAGVIGLLEVGLIVDAQYHVKSDDFLIFIMWPDAQVPQALLQKDCRKRGLEVIN